MLQWKKIFLKSFSLEKSLVCKSDPWFCFLKTWSKIRATVSVSAYLCQRDSRRSLCTNPVTPPCRRRSEAQFLAQSKQSIKRGSYYNCCSCRCCWLVHLRWKVGLVTEKRRHSALSSHAMVNSEAMCQDVLYAFLASVFVYMKWKWKLLSHFWLFVTLWTIQPMEFSRPEYWSGYRFPSPGDLPNPGIKPRSPRVQADSLAAEPQGKPFNQNQMAKVVYISPMTQLSWVHKNYITNPPTNPKSLYSAAFFSSHIPGQYFSCPKSLRARYQRIRDQPYCPEPTNIIQTSPKQFPCPALPFPQKTQ